MTRRLRLPLRLSVLVAVAALAVGCAAPAAETDDGSSADAVSSKEAAVELRGAVLVTGGITALRSAAMQRLGVESWDVYHAKTDTFDGFAWYAMGADGHVRYAILLGRSPNGESHLALANYDRDGKIGATGQDNTVLRDLLSDAENVRLGIQKANLEQLAKSYQKLADAYQASADAHQKLSDVYASNARWYSKMAACTLDVAIATSGLLIAATGALLAAPAYTAAGSLAALVLGGSGVLVVATGVVAVGMVAYAVGKIGLSFATGKVESCGSST
jgi:hypothetical protein